MIGQGNVAQRLGLLPMQSGEMKVNRGRQFVGGALARVQLAARAFFMCSNLVIQHRAHSAIPFVATE
jgi:hypothetical protein